MSCYMMSTHWHKINKNKTNGESNSPRCSSDGLIVNVCMCVCVWAIEGNGTKQLQMLVECISFVSIYMWNRYSLHSKWISSNRSAGMKPVIIVWVKGFCDTITVQIIKRFTLATARVRKEETQNKRNIICFWWLLPYNERKNLIHNAGCNKV